MSRFELTSFDNALPGGGFSSRELFPKTDTLIIPDTLYQDNRSEKAHDNVIEWDINRFGGNHIVTAACSDARLEIPMDKNTARIHTIATGGSKAPYENLLKGRNVKAAVILAHHDGDTVRQGEMPTGCGGLGAKAEIEENGKKNDPTHEYIDKRVSHRDVIVQACMTALEVASLTDKPVLAATQDHLTGEIHPQLAFWSETGTSITAWNRSISIRDLLDKQKYDVEKIYKEGLPCLNYNNLPEVFLEYLNNNRKEMDVLFEKYPDYRERQKIQNPETVIVTTDIRPTRLKYPTLFDTPGSFFRITIPRLKNAMGEDYEIDFSDEELEMVFQQIKYPIDHFNNVKNLIIETPRSAWSEKIGSQLLSQEWMIPWTEKKESQVIALETRGGKIYQPKNLITLS